MPTFMLVFSTKEEQHGARALLLRTNAVVSSFSGKSV